MKITKKSLHMGWNSHDTEIIKIKKEMRELKASVLRLEKLTDEKLLDTPEPKLKQLDQSVFDGLDAKWQFAAVDGNKGFPVVYEFEPYILESECYYTNRDGLYKDLEHMKGYDTANWQNSLIERDKVELTGSDLCRAMLERGDKYVLCYVSDFSDDYAANQAERINLITHTEGRSICAKSARWKYAVPINQKTGEPLIAADVGL